MSGIFGAVSKDNCSQILLYGTDYHSHLGTEYGGIAILGRQGQEFTRRIHNIAQFQFKSKFYDEYKQMKGNKGIGVISALQEQPMYLNSKFGPFCIVTNGLIENAKELANSLLKKGVSFTEMSQDTVNETELVAKLINQGETLIEGIEKMFSKIEGSCSLLLLNKEGVYAARDRLGYTPLVVGKREGAMAVTSETCAFVNNDFKIVKYIEPGEIVLITESGMEQKKPGGPTNQICAFFCNHTDFPASKL